MGGICCLGDVPTILAEPGISPESVSAAKKILNTALLTLIKKSSTGDARELIDNYCDSSSGETNAKELLDFLYQKYSVNDVQTVYDCISRIHSMTNASVEEKVDWVRSVTDLIFNFPNIQSLISAVTDPTQRSVCMAELDAQRETYAAILLLATSPEQANGILDFVGAKSSITVSEVVAPLKRRSERPSSESALVASKSHHKPTKKKSRKTHNKPSRPCGACGQNHLLSECPVLKECLPNAPVFNDRKGRKQTAWNGAEETTNSRLSHPSSYDTSTFFDVEVPTVKETGASSDLPVAPVTKERTSNSHECILSSTTFMCDDWVFDSRCTTHMCCDRSKFVTFEPSSNTTITGVAGEVPVLGHGKVKIGNLSFSDVAYVPSMHFNLISIQRASSVSDCQFVFDNSLVYAIFKSGEVKRFGSTKNGLYVLDLPSTLKEPVMELSFASSKLTIGSWCSYL